MKRFWQSICNFIYDKIDAEFVLFWRDDNAQRKAHTCIIDFILLTAKFHINCCKFTNRETSICCLYWRAGTFTQAHQAVHLLNPENNICLHLFNIFYVTIVFFLLKFVQFCSCGSTTVFANVVLFLCA